MARPRTKNELIQEANNSFNKMISLIDNLSSPEKDFTFDKASLQQSDGANHWSRDNNVRDVLVHLHEWHNLLLNWENANTKGINTPFLPEGYSWSNYAQMNVSFWQSHQNTTYEASRQLVKKSHEEVVALLDKYTDDSLFTKKYFKWTGTTSLGQYFISATISHYDWAIKKLKKQIQVESK